MCVLSVHRRSCACVETLVAVVSSQIVPTLCFGHLFACNLLVSACAVNYSRWLAILYGTCYLSRINSPIMRREDIVCIFRIVLSRKSTRANLYELETRGHVERDWHLAEFRFVHLIVTDNPYCVMWSLCKRWSSSQLCGGWSWKDGKG